MSDFSQGLLAAPATGPQSLSAERAQSNVPVEELKDHLLTKEWLQRQQRVLRVLQKHPLFGKARQANLSRPARYAQSLARAKQLRRLQDELGWDAEDLKMAEYLNDEMHPFALHNSMFTVTVRDQGSDEQKEHYLRRIEGWEVIGCYAQTELGHGSNTRGLECRATFDPATKEFVIHSPTITASKWWNGSLGRTANHAVVVAQLYAPAPSEGGTVHYGLHSFIVQIRDMKTHQPLPGIIVGDIGPKYGYGSMDNGYLLFNQFRVPHSSMLSRFAQFNPDTLKYTKPRSSASIYGSLTYARATIVQSARLVLARAVTIAVRYGAVRVQGTDRDGDAGTEIAILDYSTVQVRILPLLASTFALHYTGIAMKTLYAQAKQRHNDLQAAETIALLHAQSSGLKSVCTEIAANGIEMLRRTAGGHGFMASSGFVALNNDYLSKPTVEGDNWMITQQNARYLIKRMAREVKDKGESADPRSTGVSPYRIFDNGAQIVEAFRQRSRIMTYKAYLDREVHGRSWNGMLIELHKLSNADSRLVLVENFYNAISDTSLSSPLRDILRLLFCLFAYSTLSNDAIDFVGLVSESDLTSRLPQEIQTLLGAIRPHAVPLVDAWAIPDFLLDSALGSYQGDVYANLFRRAHLENPLNDITFNPYFWDDEIVKGSKAGIEGVLAKL